MAGDLIDGDAPEIDDAIPTANKRYEIIDTIGGCAISTLYKALDLTTNKEVTLKRYNPDIDQKTFEGEKKVVQSLDNEAFPKFIDDYVAQDEFGETHVMVMDNLEGKTLTDLIAKDHHFNNAQLKDILLQGLDTLEYLQTSNEKPVSHRNIGCDHLRLNDKGLLKFYDSGILTDEMARVMGRTTGITGHHWYAAPEQIEGFTQDNSDIYSLGRVMYRLVVGFDYHKKELDFDLLKEKNVHVNLVDAIKAMTEEDFNERADVDKVREILEKKYTVNDVCPVRKRTPVPPNRFSLKKYSSMIKGILVAVGILGCIGSAIVWGTKDTQRKKELSRTPIYARVLEDTWTGSRYLLKVNNEEDNREVIIKVNNHNGVTAEGLDLLVEPGSRICYTTGSFDGSSDFSDGRYNGTKLADEIKVIKEGETCEFNL